MAVPQSKQEKYANQIETNDDEHNIRFNNDEGYSGWDLWEKVIIVRKDNDEDGHHFPFLRNETIADGNVSFT